MFGGKHYWPAIYLPIAFIAFVTGFIIWVLGTIRAVREQQTRKAERLT
jgi:uncharacterized integral membrane protein